MKRWSLAELDWIAAFLTPLELKMPIGKIEKTRDQLRAMALGRIRSFTGCEFVQAVTIDIHPNGKLSVGVHVTGGHPLRPLISAIENVTREMQRRYTLRDEVLKAAV